ncbi:MAG: methyltransferase domain-containing protein [Candidatus Freyarchaeota archaeon]
MGKRRENLTEFTSDYYDYYYFADTEGIAFKRADGTVEYWSYRNPSGDWRGAEEIVRAWKTVFNPKNLLEFGAGRGTMIAYARDVGIEAEGFDFSEWATSDEGRYARCKREWLKRHDATKPWPYPNDSYDLVVGLDIMEHIYESYVFLEIATVDGVREKGYVLRRGEPIPLSTDGRTWAGHVTVLTEQDWEERLENEDWWRRRDLENWFVGLVPA